MKIIEALKELKIIEKKMQRNIEEIKLYAAFPSNMRPEFNTEAAQRKEVEARIQANMDLSHRYLALRSNIQHTNNTLRVQMGGKEYTIQNLLDLKRKMGDYILQTYKALFTRYAEMKIRSMVSDGTGNAPVPIKLYDEADKNEAIAKWMDFLDNIEARLEVINATTDLIELVPMES